jgi:antitoxin (DNA-binding transcriptional repressor) of toxin-antitoxin stability system
MAKRRICYVKAEKNRRIIQVLITDRRDFLMPATAIDVQELTTRFEEIISLAMRGTEVIVMKKNVPRARLVPLASGQARVAGLHHGAIETTEDFDAPLPEAFWVGTP